jgi:NAD-dependent dihydropyrimidine dehydrogenase PreA subunit
MKRQIIEINRDLCNGCGLCTTACAEGALELDDENKAVLVREIYCDGLGACLDVCPTGALKVIEREAEAYDPEETFEYVRETRGAAAAEKVHGADTATAKDAAATADPGPSSRASATEVSEAAGCGGGCPGLRIRDLGESSRRGPSGRGTEEGSPEVTGEGVSRVGESEASSELSNWPIQLKLVNPAAPYFREADLLIAADCTAFSLGAFHGDLLKGKRLIIACPKLDDISGYVEKLAAIIRENTIYSVTVAIMTVPCCTGMHRIVEEAVLESGKDIAVKKIVISPEGKIVK